LNVLGIALDSRGLDIAKKEKMFVFAISLLDATIQDGSTKERSNNVDRKINSQIETKNQESYC